MPEEYKNQIAIDLINRRLDHLSKNMEALKELMDRDIKLEKVYEPQWDLANYIYEELLQIRELIKHKEKQNEI